MNTVRDACQLQPNALSIKLSHQIEQLDELITAAGDGSEFFLRTHITEGMQDATIVNPGVSTKVRPANRGSCQIVNIILAAGDVDAAVGRDHANG